MIKNKSLTLLIGLILVFSLSWGVMGVSENQAPELQEAVAEGELEPLADRLPDEPLIFEPAEDIGQYGGTWNRYGTAEDFGHVRMSFYGHSLLRWVDDGLGIEENLVTDWEQNEDATEWTLWFREGVKWSDGEPMTVDDIIFWWEDMVLDTEFPDAVPDIFMAGGETVEMVKIDDYTLRLEYEAPAPLVPERLAMWPNSGIGERMIVPGHYLKQYHPEYSEDGDYEALEEHVEWWIETDTPVLTAWNPVEYEPGEHIIYERNPYFYATDPEGNQLPYIDGIEVLFQADDEVAKLQLAEGNSDFQIRPSILHVEDVSMLQSNAEEQGFEVIMWDSGSGTGPIYYPNHNHPDEEKRGLYRNPEFLRALSHAINRDRVNRMVYYDLGTPTTGTFSPKAAEYHTEKGQEVYENWRDLAVEHDPEKAEELLDEVGVVDQNGDGWRQMPSGEELILRIDADAEAGEEYVHTNELVQEDWEAIGIQTMINPVDGAQLGIMDEQAEFDIRDSWELGDGPNHLVFPQWMVPIDQSRWAPLYGSWYAIQGTPQEDVDADKPPRERAPTWEEPEEGSFVVQLQEIYDKARVEADEEKRFEYVYEMINLHIEHGPVMIGTAGDYPRIGVKNVNLRNVPDSEDMAMGGFVNPWIMTQPASKLPSTWYFAE